MATEIKEVAEMIKTNRIEKTRTGAERKVMTIFGKTAQTIQGARRDRLTEVDPVIRKTIRMTENALIADPEATMTTGV